MKGRLRISDDLYLPLEAVTEPLGILAVRRAGKSNAAVVMAEEMFDAGLHWVAIDPKGDWWGIRAHGEDAGLPVPIFGGEHGDLPLDPASGSFIADLIVDRTLTCVLDVSGFASEKEKIRFLLAFGDRLFRRKHQDQPPTHVFLEEADDYIPQKPFAEQARLVHVMARILKQGGSRGLGGTVISQRSAVVNKDVLTQIQTLFALRTTSPQDRKAIAGWVSFMGENPEIISTLPGLEDGEAWVWSPNWLRKTERFTFRRRRTYDSGATPSVKRGLKAPATLADVNIGALQEQMQATIAKAKAEDPRELRRRIAELDAVVKSAKPVVERVEVPVVPPGELARIERLIAKTFEEDNKILEIRELLIDVKRKLAAVPIFGTEQPRPPVTGRILPAHTIRPPATPLRLEKLYIEESRSTGPIRSPRHVGDDRRGGNGREMKPMLRRMLTALAQHPEGLTKAQVLLYAGYASSGDTSTMFGTMNREGLVEGDRPGSLLVISQEGLKALGPYDPLPTGGDLRKELLGEGSKLSRMERTILSAVCSAHPDSIGKGDALRAAGYSSSGDTSTAFAKLARIGYISKEGSARVRASDRLFG